MSTGFKGPIVHGGGSVNKYVYRNKVGMMPSAEFYVFHDDFAHNVATNVPAGWAAAIIDTGATVTTATTADLAAHGVISISDATASEGAAIYLPRTVQLLSGKRFFMEMRVRTDDVTDNAIQFGLSDLTATTNPEDLWTTTAANLVSFGILDGSATLGMLSDKSNSGTSVQAGDSSLPMVVDTWTVLAISYDGSALHGWKDGAKVLTWSSASTTIPTSTALAPFVGALNGNGAGGNTNLVDYVRFAVER